MSSKSRGRINPCTKLPESGEYHEERLTRSKAERRARRAARREAVLGKGVA